MDDTTLVSGRKAGADLPRHFDRAILREASDPLQQRPEILAVDVLHREKRVTVRFIDVVDAAHVRMRDLPGHAHLGVKLCQPRRIAIDIGRKKLERDRLSELQIVGTIHFAHPALAEPANHAIAPAENGARLKTSVIDPAGAPQPACRRRDWGRSQTR